MDIASGLLLTRLPEEETHGNHVRAPTIGIRDLRLTCSGKSSKFHLPEDAPKPAGGATGDDSFNVLPEHDLCELVFDIDNAFDIVDRARLEIYRRDRKDPLWTLDLMKLGLTWVRHGVHKVKWDGRIVAGDAELAGTIKDEETEHDLTGQAATPDTAKDAPFPDGWLTLEHPPYKLRLVLESDLLADRPAVAWTYAHVLLEKIELKLGPEAAIPNDGTAPTRDMDKAVRQQIETDGGLPADGATRKVFLLSNLFKMTDAEFDDTANTDFTQYKTLWGEGPRIPILAKLWMTAADGSAVALETAAKGAVALGRAKFLWDIKDPDEVAKAVDAPAIDFLTKSRDYYKTATDTGRAAKDNTYYQGDNCHVDRGGRRGPDGVTHFPDQAGYAPKDPPLTDAAFPFAVGTTVKTPDKRLWAAYSHAWVKGALKGHTGALFRPSRMAGDNYVVSVQLAYDWDKDGTFVIDNTDKDLKLPAKITAKTGIFEIWRRLHVSRYIRKTGTVPNFLPNFGQVAAYYEQVFIEMKQEIAGGDNYLIADHKSVAGGATALDYNALCQTVLGAAGFDLYDDGTIKCAPENHAAVAAAFQVPKYADFVKNLHVTHFGNPAGDMAAGALLFGVDEDVLAGALALVAELDATTGTPPANALAARLNATRAYLRNQGYFNLQSYSQTLEGKLTNAAADLPVTSRCISGSGTTGAVAPPGITVMHYQYLHSATQDYIDAGNADHDGLRGAAIDVADRARDKAVFALWRPLIPTFAHEIGHHMFLPHPNPPSGTLTALAVHDSADKSMNANLGAVGPQCLMSYHPQRHGFCGFCQLRLRGWDWNSGPTTKLNNTGAANKKP